MTRTTINGGIILTFELVTASTQSQILMNQQFDTYPYHEADVHGSSLPFFGYPGSAIAV